MRKIVTLTVNPAIDKSSSVEHVVAERKLCCKAPRYEPGGGGVNVSRAIKKLGGESVLLYLAGGLTGSILKDLLDRENLDHRPIQIEGENRESFILLEEFTGRQFRFGMPGPTLHEREWHRCLDELFAINPKPDYIVASGSLPPKVPLDFYARVARIGKQMGVRVVIDASGEPLNLALREGVFLVKPNMREFRELVGEDVKEEPQIKASALKIVESGQSDAVVISFGAAGVLVASKDIVEHILSPTVPIISKVGAGDSMVAGIVLSLARELPLKEAVRFGVAAGAAAIMTPGTELCRREDAERLYGQMIT